MDNSRKWIFAGIASVRATFTFDTPKRGRPVPRMSMQTTDPEQSAMFEEFKSLLGVTTPIGECAPASKIGSTKPRRTLRIQGPSIYDHVIPFFDTYTLIGLKAMQFQKWRNLALAIREGKCDDEPGFSWFLQRWADISPNRPKAGRPLSRMGKPL